MHLITVYFNYLYLCHSGNRNDRQAMHQLDSMEHIDYSDDPNAMGMRKQHMNIGQVRYMNDTIHDMFYTFVSSDRRTVNRDTPYKGHHPTYNAQGMMYILMGQHLFPHGW